MSGSEHSPIKFNDNNDRVELRHNGNVVGYGRYTNNFIHVLSINRDNRRCGYGTLILNEMERKIKVDRYNIVHLLAIPLDDCISRPDLFTFYKKNGYSQYSFLYQMIYGVSNNYMYKQI